MSEQNARVMTESGMQEAQERLDYLVGTRRNEVARLIETARSYGDLSENAEYDEAKKEQGRLEEEIAHLQQLLRTAVVISDEEISDERVSIGVTVEVYDLEEQETLTYMIVGTEEADPSAEPKKISNESAIGKALIGHGKGETVTVETPAGDEINFRIDKIKTPAGQTVMRAPRKRAASKNTVKLGMTVTLKDTETGEKKEYVIRAKKEDKTNIISLTTKIGKVLKDLSEGDVVSGAAWGSDHDWKITKVKKG